MNSDETIEMLYDFQAGDPNHFGRWAEDEVYDGINTAIEALRQYQPWVPCSERMPTKEDADENGYVLVIFEYGSVGEWNVQEIKYNNDRASIDLELSKITHWRPMLPEPPKGE